METDGEMLTSPSLAAWFENAFSITKVVSPHVPTQGLDPNMSRDEKLLLVGQEIFSLGEDSTFDDIMDVIGSRYSRHVTVPIKSNDTLTEVYLLHAVSKHCSSRGAYLHGIIMLSAAVQGDLQQLLQKYPMDENPSDDEEETESDTRASPAKYSQQAVLQEAALKDLENKLRMKSTECNDYKVELEKVKEELQLEVSKDIDDENKLTMLTDSVEGLGAELKRSNDRVLESDIALLEKDHDLKATKSALAELEAKYDGLERSMTVEQRNYRDMQDELEVYRPKAERLDKEEAAYAAMHERLQEFQEVKSQLAEQHKAHNDTYHRLVNREKEVTTLKKMMSEFDEIRSASEEMTVEMETLKFENRDHINEISRLKFELHNAIRDEKECLLRYQLLDEEFTAVGEKVAAYERDGSYVGDGSHEVNPMMLRELLKLRTDNRSYKDLCDQVSVGNMERLTRMLADEKSKNKFLHEQWQASRALYNTLKNKVESAEGFGHGQLFTEDDLREVRMQYEKAIMQLKASVHDHKIKAAGLARAEQNVKDEAEGAAKRYEFQIAGLLSHSQKDAQELLLLQEQIEELESRLRTVKDEDYFREGRKVYEDQIKFMKENLKDVEKKRGELAVDVRVKEDTIRQITAQLEDAKHDLELKSEHWKAAVAESQQKINELNVGNKVQEAMLRSQKDEKQMMAAHYEKQISALHVQLTEVNIIHAKLSEHSKSVEMTFESFKSMESERAKEYREMEISSFKSALQESTTRLNEFSVHNKVLQNDLDVSREALNDQKISLGYENNQLGRQHTGAQSKAKQLEEQLRANETSTHSLTTTCKVQEAALVSSKQELLKVNTLHEEENRALKERVLAAKASVEEHMTKEKILQQKVANLETAMEELKLRCEAEMNEQRSLLVEVKQEVKLREDDAQQQLTSMTNTFKEQLVEQTKELDDEIKALTEALANARDENNMLVADNRTQALVIKDHTQIMIDQQAHYDSKSKILQMNTRKAQEEVGRMAETIKSQAGFLAAKEKIVGEAQRFELEGADLKSQLAELQKEKKDLEQQLRELTSAKKELMTSSEVSSKLVERTNQALAEARSTFETESLATKKALSDAQRDISELMVKNKVQENALLTARSDVTELRKALEAEKASMKTLQADLTRKLIETGEGKKQSEYEAASGHSEHIRVKSQLTDCQDRLHSTVIDLRVSQETIRSYSEELAELKALSDSQVREMKTQLETASIRLDALNSELIDKESYHRSSYDDQSKELKSVVTMLTSMKTSLSEAEEKNKTFAHTTQQQLRTINELTAVREVQEKTLESTKEALEELRRLSEKEEKQLRGDLSDAQTRINELLVTNTVQETLLKEEQKELESYKSTYDGQQQELKSIRSESFIKAQHLTEANKEQELRLRDIYKEEAAKAQKQSESEITRVRSALLDAQERINELTVALKVSESETKTARDALISKSKQYQMDLDQTKSALADALGKVDVLNETSIMHHDKFRQNKESSSADVKRLQKEVADAKAALSEVERTLHEKEVALRVLDTSLEHLQDQLSDSQLQIVNLTKQNRDLTNSVSELSLAGQVRDMEVVTGREKIQDMKKVHESELRELREALSHTQKGTNELLVTTQVQSSLLISIKTELTTLKISYENEKIQCKTLQSHLIESAKNDGLYDAKKQLETEVARLTVSLSETQDRLNEIRHKNRHMEGVIEGHNDELDSLRRQYAAEINSLKKANYDQDSKIHSLEDTIRTLKLSEPQLNLLMESQTKISELTVRYRLTEGNLVETKMELQDVRKRLEMEMGSSKGSASGTQRKISELLEINVVQEKDLKIREIQLGNLKQEYLEAKKGFAGELRSVKESVKEAEDKSATLMLQNKLHQGTIRTLNQELIEVKRKFELQLTEAQARVNVNQGRYSEYVVSNKVQETLLQTSKDELLQTKVRYETEMAAIRRTQQEQELECRRARESQKAAESEIKRLNTELLDTKTKANELIEVNQVQEKMIATATQEDDDDFGMDDLADELIALEVQQAKARLEQEKKKITESQQESEEVTSRLKDVEAELAQVKAASIDTISSLEKRLAETALRIQELTSENEILNTEFKTALQLVESEKAERAKLTELEKDLIKTKSELAQAQLKVDDFTVSHKEFEEAVRGLKKEISDCKAARNDLAMEHREHIRKLEGKHQSDIDQVTREVRAEMKARVEKYLSDLGEENERLEESLATAQAEILSLRSQLSQSLQEVDRLKNGMPSPRSDPGLGSHSRDHSPPHRTSGFALPSLSLSAASSSGNLSGLGNSGVRAQSSQSQSHHQHQDQLQQHQVVRHSSVTTHSSSTGTTFSSTSNSSSLQISTGEAAGGRSLKRLQSSTENED